MKFDREMLNRYRMEPRSEREERGLSLVGPADFSVYSMKLELIVEEAKAVMVRTAISDAIQSDDCALSLYSAAGDLVIAAAGTYAHSVTGQLPIKYILKNYVNDPTVGIKPGDLFFANEVLIGGIHSPDILLIMPMFHETELIGWVAAVGHNQEIGETDPGGMENVRSRYDEGLKVPPLRLYENYRMKGDVMAMLCNMVRNHRMLECDLQARAAACVRTEERLLPLFVEKGADFMCGVMRKMCEASGDGARAAFAQMLDGTFRQVLFMDFTGTREPGLMRIVVTLVKKGDHLTIDLNGCSPQAPNAQNCPTHVARAAINAMFPGYVVPDVPCSSGLLENVSMVAPPEGSLLNPHPEAATIGSVQPLSIVAIAFVQCIVRAGYATRRETISLPMGWLGSLFAFAGLDQYGHMTTGFAGTTFNSAGGGARPHRDGVDAMGMLNSMSADSLDIEHDEIQHPFLYGFRRLVKDQAGLGKRRGGAGASISVYMHDTPSIYAQASSSPSRFPCTVGVFGGYAANCGPALTMRNGGTLPQTRSDFEPPLSVQDLARKGAGSYEFNAQNPFTPMQEGDGFAAWGAGGGGWGDVLEREPADVVKDLRVGIYSDWTARNVFCVVYDPATMVVDAEATKALRAARRKERLVRGKRYDDFIKEWEKLSPPKELLRTYGSWPHPTPVPGSADSRTIAYT